MKKMIPFLAFIMLSLVGFAQRGVNFEHLTLDEALEKAKAEKKLVFLDCYTTWCGPCKYMANVIFPMEKAGEFFNPRFVSVKFDMEKEGKALKDKLKVKAYPSFYILRPDGTVQHCIVGGEELDLFVEKVKMGLYEKTSLLYLSQKYEKGKMSKQELMAYKVALDNAYDHTNSEKVAKELTALLTDKDKMKPEFWPIFEDQSCVVGSADFRLLLANRAVFEKNTGKEKLDEYLYLAYCRALGPYSRPQSPYASQQVKTDSADLKELGRQIAVLNLTKQGLLQNRYELAEATFGGHVEAVVSILEKMAPAVSKEELPGLIRAFAVVKGKATKADFARMAAIGEKIMAQTENESDKESVSLLFDSFRKAAHVGVCFEDLTLDQALEKAKRLNQMVFMDGYTSWCGPCKYMTNTIFPMEKVGDFMNRFVCVKYDMEKGDGPELAKKYGIMAFPTFLLIKPDGFVQHKMVGGGEADVFIDRLKEGLDATKASGMLEMKYQDGVRDKEFLLLYTRSLASLYSPEAPKVAAELLQSLSDEEKVTEPYWFIFESRRLSPKGSEGEKYLLANRERFNATVGREKVDKYLCAVFRQKLKRILTGSDAKTTVKDLDEMKKEITALKPGNEKVLLSNINIAKAVIGGNPAQLLAVCEKEMKQLPEGEFLYAPLAVAAKAKATPAQIARWIKMGQQLLAQAQDVEYKKQLEKFLKDFEGKES